MTHLVFVVTWGETLGNAEAFEDVVEYADRVSELLGRGMNVKGHGATAVTPRERRESLQGDCPLCGVLLPHEGECYNPDCDWESIV